MQNYANHAVVVVVANGTIRNETHKNPGRITISLSAGGADLPFNYFSLRSKEQ